MALLRSAPQSTGHGACLPGFSLAPLDGRLSPSIVPLAREDFREGVAMAYWFWLFFSFRGRLGRGFFWLAVLGNVLASLLVELGMESDWAGDAVSPTVYDAVYIVFNAILSLSATAVAAKRFHDRGKTAWLAPAAGAVLIVTGEFMDRNDSGAHYAIASLLNLDTSQMTGLAAAVLAALLISLGILLWLLIDLGILRGEAGANRYGPDPRPAAGGATA